MLSFNLALLLLAPLASAHFDLKYPLPRGTDHAKSTEGPCGGLTSHAEPASQKVKRHNGEDHSKDGSIKRTEWPLDGGQVELRMGHDRAMVQVVLGLGNNPGASDFNIVLVPTVEEQGTGSFCLPEVRLPQGLNVTDGTNATLQVITNGDPTGGLYSVSAPIYSSAFFLGDIY